MRLVVLREDIYCEIERSRRFGEYLKRSMVFSLFYKDMRGFNF